MKRLMVLTVLLTACSAIQPPGPDPAALTMEERSVLSEAEGDSLLSLGLGTEASGAFERAALLRTLGDPARHALAVRAASCCEYPAVTVANLLLEEPDSLSPYTALAVGGRDAAPAVLSFLARGGAVMPEYLGLVLADTMLAADDLERGLAALSYVTTGLPGAADRKRTELTYQAAILGQDPVRADSIFREAETSGDSELISLLCHRKGMLMLRRGEPGYGDVLVRSFTLWPAAPVHAAAYRALRDEMLTDPWLAGASADAFYDGGLWNELYDLALASTEPPAHLWYLAARTRDRLGFYGEAVRMLEDYLRFWPSGDDAPDAMINLGRNLGRLGETEAGFDMLMEYARLNPSHGRIGNLPWYIGDMYALNRMWSQAEPWFRTTLLDYPGNVTADDAHFYLCFALMETGREEEAVTELESFISRRTGSVYLSSARYWLGVLLSDAGDPGGAEVLSDLVEDAPTSLPAFFARERLGMEPWAPVFTEELLSDWMIRHGNPPVEPPESALRGLFLQRAGLRSLAQGEFLRAEEEVGGADRLAPFYVAGDVWERRPMSGYRMWDISGSPEDRPRELWMLRYQKAWPELVLPYCEEYGLDPLLAWAIVRNESMFQPDCYSTAGARGLIQMIPSTSQYVAEGEGWEDYSPDRLYDPAVSLEYGICYIADVAEELDGGPVVTAAAYNGGPHNAMHWGARDMTPDRFYSLITFNETRAYTQNVHLAFITYVSLYQ